MTLSPISLKAILKPVLWGTQRFGALFHARHIAEPIGECWLCVDTPAEQSIVENGVYAGLSLREFLEQAGESYGFSQNQCKNGFNMLNKYVDTSDALSVQVHPDDSTAACHPNYQSKDECWYIVDAMPGAYVYAGLKDGVTRDSLAAAIASKTVVGLLRQYPAQPGDIFHIPAGMVHSIGAGLLVAELGTSSTTTLRLYDWDRLGPDGSSRELHIEQAISACNFNLKKNSRLAGAGGLITERIMNVASELGVTRLLVDSQYFSVAEVKDKPGTRRFCPSVPLLVYQVSGTSRISSQQQPGNALAMSLGTSIIYPAGVPGIIEYDNDSIVLITTPGNEKY